MTTTTTQRAIAADRDQNMLKLEEFQVANPPREVSLEEVPESPPVEPTPSPRARKEHSEFIHDPDDGWNRVAAGTIQSPVAASPSLSPAYSPIGKSSSKYVFKKIYRIRKYVRPY